MAHRSRTTDASNTRAWRLGASPPAMRAASGHAPWIAASVIFATALTATLVHVADLHGQRDEQDALLAYFADRQLDDAERIAATTRAMARALAAVERIERLEGDLRDRTGLDPNAPANASSPPIPLEEALATLRAREGDSAADIGPGPEVFDALAARASRGEHRTWRLAEHFEDLVAWLDQVPALKPATGKLNDVFQRYATARHRKHHGLDIDGQRGDSVYAAGDGVVVYSQNRPDYGRLVIVDHGYEVRTRYAHLDRLDVRVGDRVRRGQQLGRLGNSGRSTGPHLHYEVRLTGRPVDPAPYLIE